MANPLSPTGCKVCGRQECPYSRLSEDDRSWHDDEHCNYGNGSGEEPCAICAALRDCRRNRQDWRALYFTALSRAERAETALESIACLAGEGPDVYAMEGKPLIDLLMVIAREACGALADRARRGTP